VPEFVHRKLGLDLRACHRALALACGRWKAWAADHPARDYALRFRLGHALDARDWPLAARVVADVAYIVQRATRFDFADIHTDARAAARLAEGSAGWGAAFAEWERFLRHRLERLRRDPAAYRMELLNEFAPRAPAALRPALEGMARRVDIPLRKVSGSPALMGVGHTGSVDAVAFAPDGRLATGSRDGTAKLWAADGRPIATCGGHGSPVYAVAFAPDGRLATGSDDRTANLWAADGRPIATCAGHGSPVYAVAFAPDGRLATGSADRTARLWAADGRPIATCAGHGDLVTAVAFAPDGRLATGSDDGTVRLWAADGRPIATCAGHGGGVDAVAFAPMGEWLASSGYDRCVRLWRLDPATGRPVGDAAVLFYDLPIRAVAFVEGPPPRLLVADSGGRAFVYEVNAT
jgi:hypothetical protein